jgi:glutaminyl-tRNA synthetase
LQLVDQRHVTGWDDPRLPTLKGLRRRGYTPEAIRRFCHHIGVAKRDAVVEMALLEHFIREDLNQRALRVMAVLRPLRVVIDNYPEGRVEDLEAVNNPEDLSTGNRKVPFSRVLYIEQDDFREDPPKKFFRLSPGQEVRLRYAYIIKCVGVVKDDRTGQVTELHCTYDPSTRSIPPGMQTAASSEHRNDSRKVKGTIHWVSASHALPAEVRLYDTLLATADPGEASDDWTVSLNPNSLERLSTCLVEPGLGNATPGSRYQFERQGYFCVDPDSSPGKLVFNRTVALRDSWAKIEKKVGT